jgi:PhzF family phenazine biosynthesis protein
VKQYIVDAFTDRVFHGNQAAVCVLDNWVSDALMQSIARENNFSETAFTVKEGNRYHLRWFTPGGEIDFCGHATLGTAYVLFRFYEETAQLIFRTMIGELIVENCRDMIEMDFPSYTCRRVEVTDEMETALGIRPLEAYIDRDLLLILKDAKAVRNLKPDYNKMKMLDGLLVAVTAQSDDPAFDCMSRVFAPKLAVDEDPVTGSTHCMITPYWCERLKKDSLVCFQASDRTGVLYTRRDGKRIRIAGKAVLYSEGEILKGLG